MTTIGIFTFIVNGTELESQYEKLTGLEILEIAISRGVIDGKPENYILQNADDDDKKYKPDDTVDLSVDRQFLALPTGPTPVA